MAKRTIPERSLEDIWADKLRDVRSNRINDPSVIYKVGDRVAYGAMDRAIVDEIIDSGKILKIKIWYTNKENQQEAGKKVHDGAITFVAWHDVEPYRNQEENSKIEQLCFEDEINLHFMQSGISSLFHYYYECGLNMEPEYQRGHVWNLDDKVSLIDSIFNNVEIGKFVLIFTGYSGKSQYEILDGKQRLSALVEFFEGRFKYRGKTFHEMHWRDQRHFENFHIDYARTENVMTNEQKYRYFLKLNTQGKAQDPSHIEYVKDLLRKSHG